MARYLHLFTFALFLVASSGQAQSAEPDALAVSVGLAAPSWGQARSLPELQAFLAKARVHLQEDEILQSQYVFVEKRRDLKLDKSGQQVSESVSVYESYPGLPGKARWRRQLVKNGRPVSPAELAKQDRERREHVLKYAAQMERESTSKRTASARQREKRRRESEATIDDALRIYDIRMLGREVRGGHEAIVLSFTPRPGVQPRTGDGKVLKNFSGKAWISETEFQLARLELEAVDTVSIGLGVVARIHQGSHLVFERRKVNGEEWLPVAASYTVSARMLLLKRVRVGAVSEFSDYRKFTVATETAIASPKDER